MKGLCVFATILAIAVAKPGGLGLIDTYGSYGSYGYGTYELPAPIKTIEPIYALPAPVVAPIAVPELVPTKLTGPVSTGTILEGPKSTGAIITGPSTTGAILTSPVKSGAVLTSVPYGLPAPIALPAPVVLPAPVALPAPAPVFYSAPAAYGTGVVTKGGGAIGVSKAGAVVTGPPTAPVLIKGPSGKISADGLWGPTLEGLPKKYYY